MTGGPLPALGHVALARGLRRLRGDLGRPWAILGVVIAVACAGGVQMLALRGDPARADPAVVEALAWLWPLVIAASLVMAPSTPPRATLAEAAWVLGAPGGARALVARVLLVRPLALAAIACAGTTAARGAAGRPVAAVWEVALAGAALALAVRLALAGGSLLALGPHGARALRAAGLGWAAALAAATAIDVPGERWIALEPLADPLLASVLVPGAADPAVASLTLLGLLALSAVVLAAAGRLVETTYAAARRTAEAQAALRRWRDGQQLTLARFRDGASSLRGWDALSGERALAFRSLAQERRQVLPSLVAGGLALDLAVPSALLVLAPEWAWTWTVAALAGSFLAGGTMLARELDHHFLHSAGLQAVPALGWLAAVRGVHRALSGWLAWAPLVLMPGLGLGAWLAGLLLVPCVVALGEAAGALAVARTDRPAGRFALRVAGGLAGLLAAAAVLVGALAIGAPPPAAGAAAALVAGGAALAGLTLAARRVWRVRR
jgi:hypothetical protein